MSEPITVLAALKSGVAACRRNYPAAVWTYVLSVLASMPVAIAVAVFVGLHTSSSELAPDFARGFDPLWWVMILRRDQTALPLILASAAGLIGFWTFMSTYLAAATIGAVSRADRTSTSEFFGGAGRTMGRMLRLLMFSVPFYALTVVLPWIGCTIAVNALTRDMVSERGVLAIRGTGILISLLLFAWASTAHDLMRVEAVARGERRARYAFWRGLERAARRPFAAIILSGIFGGTALAATLLASLADVRLPRASWTLIAAGILFQQSIVFLRALLRIALAGAEVAFVMSTPATSRRPSTFG